MSGTGQGYLGEVWDGSETPFVGPDGSMEAPRCPRPVGGPSQMSEMSWGTLLEVRDRSRDHQGGPGRVGGLSRRSSTGQGTLWEVRNGSATHEEVRDMLEDPLGGPGLVRGPF